MWTVLLWLLWFVLGLLGLLILLLHVPVGVWLEGSGTSDGGRLRGYFGVPLGLLGGAVVLSMERQVYQFVVCHRVVKEGALSDLNKRVRQQKKKKKKKKKQKKAKAKFSLRTFEHYMNTPRWGTVLGRALRLIIVRGDIRGRVGLDDPADTAYIGGLLALLQTVAPRSFRDVSVDYTDATFEGEADLRIVIWIPYIVIGALVIAASRDGRALIRHLVAGPKPKLAEAEKQ